MQKEAILKGLRAIVGEKAVITDPAELKIYGVDWTKLYKPNPLAACLPKSTQEVSELLKFCYQHNLPVVPSGGRTGLAGGAVAEHEEIVISLAAMNKILEVDGPGMAITAEAGAVTQKLQEAAHEVGLTFPLDLAAKGSCQIGGNLATNAGGLKFIRYGGAREQVLGLTAVLADGTILDCHSQLRKNNTGYDLKQLLIGSEGTLGIITEATLRLTAKPESLQLMCVGVRKASDLLAILQVCQQRGLLLSAFEFFSDLALSLVLKQFSAKTRAPTDASYPFYALIEVESSSQIDALSSVFEHLFEANLAADGVIAQSSQQWQELWNLRELITEAIACNGRVRKNDIALPVGKLAIFVNELQSLLASAGKAPIQVVLFGHIGDGNIHLNYIAPPDCDVERFNADATSMENHVFQLVAKFRGSISAEHGIGLLKKDSLHLSRNPLEIQMMKEIKKLFDPKGILNPGKIFD